MFPFTEVYVLRSVESRQPVLVSISYLSFRITIRDCAEMDRETHWEVMNFPNLINGTCPKRFELPLTTGLENQKVLITAASQGIGFGVAKAFLGEKAKVVINSSNDERLKKAEDTLSTIGEVHRIAGDLSSKSEIEKVVSTASDLLGGIDVLAYVTGSPSPGTVMEKNYEEWEYAAKLLTISPAYLARRVA